jgi:hypothetical protein
MATVVYRGDTKNTKATMRRLFRTFFMCVVLFVTS